MGFPTESQSQRLIWGRQPRQLFDADDIPDRERLLEIALTEHSAIN
jgi:hypothetical protein